MGAHNADAASRDFLGNMPQAFTHLALIGSAVNLELFEHGGDADRARLAILRQSGTIHRLTSSAASTMLWPCASAADASRP